MGEVRVYPFVAILLGVLIVVSVNGAIAATNAPGAASSPSFASEQVFSPTADDWEPTVAADTSSSWVYQAVTYINASKTCSSCPGTAVFFRASSDGGSTWRPAHPIFLGDGWQFDPQIQVATNGTIYLVFLVSFDPGSVLFKSTDHGVTWTGPVSMNAGLGYNDKPILVISPSGKDVYVAFNVKTTSWLAVSHNYGASFASPVQTSNESLWWYSYGGAWSPDGSVYFAQVGESGGKPTGRTTNQGHIDGREKIFVLKVNAAGTYWTNTYLDSTAIPPACPVFGCYQDFLSGEDAVAADSAGNLMVAYVAGSADFGPKQLFVRTSTDGIHWSSRSLVNAQGDSDFPALVAGATAKDFRLAWMDSRSGAYAWNLWFARTTDGGSSWSAAVRLSDLASGAPYISSEGFAWPFGDYFGLAVDSVGTNHVIWGESDGSSIYCCGGSWFTKGG